MGGLLGKSPITAQDHVAITEEVSPGETKKLRKSRIIYAE
jgi:hypothetical protein